MVPFVKEYHSNIETKSVNKLKVPGVSHRSGEVMH